VGQFIAEFLASGDAISAPVENRFCDRWGQTRWFRSVLARVRYRGRDAIQFVTRPVDSEGPRADMLLRDYRALVENAGDGIAKLDAQGRFLFANERLRQIVGRDAVALGHSLVADLVHPSRREEGLRFLRPGAFETCLLRDGGQIAEVDVVVTPLGPEPEFMALIRDVTEKRTLERELRRRERLQSLGLLAGSVAHDLNGFLGVVQANRALAARAAEAGRSPAAYLEEIGRACDTAAATCKQLLTGAGRATRRAPIDLGAVVARTLRMLRSSIDEGVVVESITSPGMIIDGDEAALEALVVNLVTNAVDAVSDVHPTRRVVVTVAPTSQAAGARGSDLKVEDNGVGIDPATREHMFDPFFTAKQSGHGLGLSSVLGIVQTHSGSIAVDSEPGRGTKVVVSFPLSRPPSRSAELVPSAPSPTRGFVVIADDEPAFRRSVRLLLDDAGFDTREAADGEEALELVRGNVGQVVAVVLDSRLPKLPGSEVARAMKEARPDLPVIMVSGDLGAVDAVAGVSLLAKAFEPTALLRLLREETSSPKT
jgi:PAS domain S-box-containing protein